MSAAWSDDERARIRDAFQNWSADEWPGSAHKARAASAAAERAYLDGRSRADAVAAGIEAAAEIPSRPKRNLAAPSSTRPHDGSRPARPVIPVHPGSERAHVVSVNRQSLLGGPRATITLNIRAARESDNSIVDVQMTGVFLDGTVAQGDCIDIPSGNGKDGLVRTSAIFNVTSGAPVQMLRGVRGIFARQTSEWGYRQALLGAVAAVVFFVLIFGWFIFVISL